MSGHEAPLHPAARATYDEQGRDLRLGLSEAELRLECLKLSLKGRDGWHHADVVPTAEAFTNFVLGTDQDHPASDGAGDHGGAKQSQVFGRDAKAAEPHRPPLSDAARSELRRKALALHDDVRRDSHHRENAHQTMVAYDEKIAGISQQIADIERDLGERFA